MNRRDFLKLAGFTAAGTLLSPLHKTYAAAKTQKPNIIIILADDLGWADVGYHGGRIATPNIDRLAREGVRLENFHACPLCSPTRAGLMTGRWPIRYGMGEAVITPWRKYGLPTTEQTLADLVAKAGYERRGAFGKWHLGHYKKKYLPLNRGFTHFYGHYNGMFDYFT
ncbi:MAG: sulfatase-like hydrolase/transferase, partial [Planctomycetota bacterium]